MNRRHKASLICILGLGTFATAAALVKLSYLPTYGRSGDLLWDSRNLTMWTVTECNVGIIAGNLPCLKPLFRSILVSTYGSGSRKNTQPKYFSNPYASGSKQRSVGKSYGPLSSDRATDGGPLHYREGGETYILTTIDATRNKEGTADRSASFEQSSPGLDRSSSESIARLNTKAHAPGTRGNITVTTKVDVTESVHSTEGFENARMHDQPQAKELV